MSILIRGMEMPKSRPVCIVIDAAGQARRYDLNNDRYADDKLFEVVSVPPHGRCIDADAYESLLRGLGSRDYRREKGTICDAIKFLHPHYTPTIIPADSEGEDET